MNLSAETITTLAHKYLSGQASEEEQTQLYHALQTEQGKNILSNVMDIESLELMDSPVMIDQSVSSRMKNRLQESIQLLQEEDTQHQSFPWLRVAAAVVMVVLSGLGLYSWHAQDRIITIATTFGEKKTIVLPDNTSVVLNANSSIAYATNWEGQTREVTLDGEAYFDVVHDIAHPFIVHTSKIDIRVLGTSFNVKSYDNDDAIETTLIKGKVAIQKANDTAYPELVLAPSQKAVFNKVSQNLVMSSVRTEVDTSWKTGKLMFEDETFANVIRDLERKYGVTFNVADPQSLACHFTANITDETLPEVMEMFKATTGIEYELNGHNVLVKGTLCNQ
jgi:ferric-dicitrate binding protein FerR (iron transport regulator)